MGDILLIEAGDQICADGRLIECASVQVNESALTGESVNIDKDMSDIGAKSLLLNVLTWFIQVLLSHMAEEKCLSLRWVWTLRWAR